MSKGKQGALRDRSDAASRDRAEQAMLRQYRRSHSPQLRRRLIERFMPLARSLAWRYRSSVEPIEDLVQVANEGLIRAVDGYDPTRSSRFRSYAIPTILGALRHHFRDSTQSVHVARGLGERIQKVRIAAGELKADGSRGERRLSRIAALTGLSEEQVDEALKADCDRRPVSIDRERRGLGDNSPMAPLVETIGDRDPGFERAESSLAARGAQLDSRDRSVLALRFGRGVSQREVGESIGVSQMQVSRIERRALGKLLAAVRAAESPASEAEGI